MRIPRIVSIFLVTLLALSSVLLAQSQKASQKAAHTGADELFVMSAGPTLASRIHSLELIAEEGVTVRP